MPFRLSTRDTTQCSIASSQSVVRAVGLLAHRESDDGASSDPPAAVLRRATYGTLATHAAKEAMATIPIVMIRLHIGRIIEFLAKNRLPGMFQSKESVTAGGFIAYGPSLPDLFGRAAGYVHRILQGSKPADLPVELPTKFDLAVNLKTAKALGLELTPTFIARADEVIE